MHANFHARITKSTNFIVLGMYQAYKFNELLISALPSYICYVR